jgi:hypothetical protein
LLANLASKSNFSSSTFLNFVFVKKEENFQEKYIIKMYNIKNNVVTDIKGNSTSVIQNKFIKSLLDNKSLFINKSNT